MTNKQWLSTLEDEKLAKLLFDYDDYVPCNCCTGYPKEASCFNYCREGFIDWLKQDHKEQTEMTECQKMKQEFVCNYLSPLLVECADDILGATYGIEDGDEIVTIEHDYGGSPTKVRVNMDNPMALCRDVFRALGDN